MRTMKNVNRIDACRKKKYLKLLSGVALLAMAACSENDNTSSVNNTSRDTEIARSELSDMLDSIVESDNVVNTMIAVNNGSQEGSFGLARGVANPVTNEQMTADHQFHIASMTKPFTATLLLQLVEEGRFTLDTTLGEAFGDSILQDLFPQYSFTKSNSEGVLVGSMTINDIQQHDRLSQGNSVTLRQLTQHSHGMPDITFDSVDGADSLGALTILGFLGAPLPADAPAPRQWSGVALLEYYLASGLPAESLFSPGSGYHYGDTGALVAALLIEKTTGMSLASNYRSRIFDPLGMNDTFLMHYEEPRSSSSPGLSHRHYDLSGIDPSLVNIDIDEVGWNTSLDFAGGGLVSTAADIDKFYRALFEGDLVSNNRVFGDVAYRVDGDLQAPVYGIGFALDIDPATNRVLSYEHGGFWGSYMAYFPANRTSVVFTANQVEFDALDQLIGKLREIF